MKKKLAFYPTLESLHNSPKWSSIKFTTWNFCATLTQKMQISFGAAHMPSIKLRYSIDDENPFGIRVTRGVNSENLFFICFL